MCKGFQSLGILAAPPTDPEKSLAKADLPFIHSACLARCPPPSAWKAATRRRGLRPGSARRTWRCAAASGAAPWGTSHRDLPPHQATPVSANQYVWVCRKLVDSHQRSPIHRATTEPADPDASLEVVSGSTNVDCELNVVSGPCPSGVFSGPIAGLPRSSHFVGPSGGAQQSASFAALQRSILAGLGFRPVRWLANRAWFVVGSESSPWGGRTVSKAQNFSAGLFEGCRQTPGKLRR